MVRTRGALVIAAALSTTGLTASALHAQSVRFGQSRIVIDANPSRVVADGQTFSRIRVEVRGRDDRAVPDGTEVWVHTDLGDLTTDLATKKRDIPVKTAGGFAEVLLTSDEPGTATVRVQYGTSYNQELVEFVPLGEVGERDSTVVHVTGKYVGYCSDLNLIEARRPAELRYRGLILEADQLQVNPETLVAKAYVVKMRRRKAEVECEDVYLDLAVMKGVYRRFGDLGPERVSFNGFTLKALDEELQTPDDAFRFDDREGRIWMAARSAAVFPRQKIVLRNASLYVDRHKIMSYPPYWVIAFEGYQGSSNTQFVQFSSYGGLAVDFPIFFSVTDTSTGAIKIQKGATSGSVMARNAWTLAFEQTYEQPGQEARGVFLIDGLPSSTWGVHFRDSRKIMGGADSDLSIAWPDHKSLFTDYSVYHYGRTGHLGVRTHADRAGDTGEWSYGLNADFLSTSVPWGGDTQFRWGTGLRAGHDPWVDEGFVVEHRVSSYLDFSGWQPSPSTSLIPSLSDVFAWDTENRYSNVARAQIILNQRLSRGVNFNLRYSLEHRSGENRYAAFDAQQGIDQQVNLNLSAYPARQWDAFVNTSYGITDETLYAFGAVNYRPWSKWRLGVIGSYYKYSGIAFDDIEVSFNRQIGSREVGVRWSKADNRFSLQVGQAGF
jgi:hypothetical protein